MTGKTKSNDVEKRAAKLIAELRSLYTRDYFSSEAPFNLTVGGLIREARGRKGISRAQLSKATGISQNSLANYEKAGDEDGQYPPIPKLALLCIELGIDPREVLKRTFRLEVIDGKIAPDLHAFDEFLQTLDVDERKIHELNDDIHWAWESFREQKDISRRGRIKNISLERENKKLKGELTRLRMKIKNGPDLDDPSRSKNTKNNTEAVDAASTRPKKG